MSHKPDTRERLAEAAVIALILAAIVFLAVAKVVV